MINEKKVPGLSRYFSSLEYRVHFNPKEKLRQDLLLCFVIIYVNKMNCQSERSS